MDANVTTISFKNLAKSDSWGTDVNGSFRLGKRFSGFVGGNVFKLVTEGGSTTSVAGTDAVTWSARVNGTADVTPTFSVQAFHMYRAPMKVEGGRFSKMQFTNITFKKKVDGDKAFGEPAPLGSVQHGQVPRPGGHRRRSRRSPSAAWATVRRT